jgi:hypothetical protein
VTFPENPLVTLDLYDSCVADFDPFDRRIPL